MPTRKPKYTLEIEASANGRVGKATVTALDKDGKVLLTDRGDLLSAPERDKLCQRMADRLKVDPGRFQKALEAALNDTLTEHRGQPAEAGPEEGEGSCGAVLL